MKYIRTKDGKIINLEGWQYDKYNECYFNKKYRLQDNVYQNLIYKQDIVKQADTIEELCDEFVLGGSSRPKVCPTLPSAKEMKKYLDSRYKINTTIFGAIWTDRGLIYVAKMNEKGDLELL